MGRTPNMTIVPIPFSHGLRLVGDHPSGLLLIQLPSHPPSWYCSQKPISLTRPPLHAVLKSLSSPTTTPVRTQPPSPTLTPLITALGQIPPRHPHHPPRGAGSHPARISSAMNATASQIHIQ